MIVTSVVVAATILVSIQVTLCVLCHIYARYKRNHGSWRRTRPSADLCSTIGAAIRAGYLPNHHHHAMCSDRDANPVACGGNRAGVPMLDHVPVMPSENDIECGTVTHGHCTHTALNLLSPHPQPPDIATAPPSYSECEYGLSESNDINDTRPLDSTRATGTTNLTGTDVTAMPLQQQHPAALYSLQTQQAPDDEHEGSNFDAVTANVLSAVTKPSLPSPTHISHNPKPKPTTPIPIATSSSNFPDTLSNSQLVDSLPIPGTVLSNEHTL